MQIEKDNEIGEEANDWAVLPFDESEDEARWTKLIEETDELIADAEKAEAIYGELLTENKLSDIEHREKPDEDELF